MSTIEICSAPVLEDLSAETLEEMAEAALNVLECYRVLQKSETNVVAEILRGADDFVQWEHYPDDDVIDYESQSQYFYHAHEPDERGQTWAGEHGHFHTFMRRKGMPEGVAPAPVPDYSEPEREADANCHLIAISMNPMGHPIRLFTVNRWVTGDTWYTAADATAMLPRFEVDQALPSWPVNVWITSMLRLFRPQIEDLLARRDEALSNWAAAHPDANPYEAEEIEVLSWNDIAVDAQAHAIDAALRAQGHPGFIS